jgi:hypothetical protein
MRDNCFPSAGALLDWSKVFLRAPAEYRCLSR